MTPNPHYTDTHLPLHSTLSSSSPPSFFFHPLSVLLLSFHFFFLFLLPSRTWIGFFASMSSSSVRSRASAGSSSITPALSESSRSASDGGLSSSERRPKPLAIVFLGSLAVISVLSLLLVPLNTTTVLFTIAWALLGSLSDSAGYHRLWAHKSYEAALPLKIVFALFGAANFTGSIISWVRDHRAHHRQADTPRVRDLASFSLLFFLSLIFE